MIVIKKNNPLKNPKKSIAGGFEAVLRLLDREQAVRLGGSS